MRSIYHFLGKVFGLGFIFFFFSTNSDAQIKDSALNNAINAQAYTFHATLAIPQRSGSKHLTSGYSVKVSTTSVVSVLPYYGRAYSAPYGGGGGGFDFTSEKFDYTVNPGKKDSGWEVSIKPKDVQDVREFALSVTSDGYGTLRVISNNRDAITFRGYIDHK